VTYTRGRLDTIDSPDDEHLFARNTYRNVINKYRKKNSASSSLFTKIVIKFVYLYLTFYFVNYFAHLQYTKADLLDGDLFGCILCILVYYNLLLALNFLKLKDSVYFTYLMLLGLTMCYYVICLFVGQGAGKTSSNFKPVYGYFFK